MPAASNFSLNFGRMPVGRRRPWTLPSTIPGLLEDEHVLENDLLAFHALDLGDVRDLARAVLQTRDLHDHVERARDLLLDGTRGQVDAGHEAHRLEAGEHVAR